MKLSREEMAMRDGYRGEAAQKAIELLIALGECYDAPSLIPISGVHLSAANPVTAGKGGVMFIRDLAEHGAAFVVPTTVNPASIEPFLWKEMGFNECQYAEQKAISKDIVEMGGLDCNTCTPYEIGHAPRRGEHIAWCESSAIIYANAVLGAKTNREGGPSALAAAITGRTPLYGYHLDDKRHAKIKIDVTIPLAGEGDYAILGYFTGKIARDMVPVFSGILPTITKDELKCLGTALATSGMVAHFHIVGVTPEAPSEKHACGLKKLGYSDTISFDARDRSKTEESLSSAAPEEADIVVLGCPHASILQIRRYATLLSGRKKSNNVEIWIQVSHTIKSYADDIGLTGVVESSGARLISNTCIVVMPRDFLSIRFGVMATDSPKLAYYTSTTKEMRCYCGNFERFVDAVTHKI